VARLLHRVLDAFKLGSNFVVGGTNVKPVVLLDIGQIGLVDFGALGQFLRTTVSDFAIEELFDTVKRIGFHNPQLVVQVKTEALELIINDLLGTLVAHNAFAGEDLHVDDGALRSLAHAQRGVFHVAGLFAEDRTQKFFFRRQRGFALWRDFADQRVAWLDFSADINNARLIKAVELLLGQVGNIAGDLLAAELV
jgi:hypothetical protein